MATYKTTGIVLRRHNLGEADRIITFLTPDRGKLRAVARGVRRIGSRQAGHLELFSQVDLMLAEGRNLDIITSARLRRYPEQIGSDYARLRHGYVFASLLDRLIEVGPSQGLYNLARVGFDRLDAAGVSSGLELGFKLQLLDRLGYRPNLERCGRCGRAVTVGSIDAAAGGLVCRDCAVSGLAALDAPGLELWRRLLAADQPPASAGDESIASVGLAVCDTFYEYIFGRAFGPTI